MSAFLRKYATATTLNFPLISYNSVSFTSTASLTTADMKLSLNEGAFTTAGTAIVNEGSFGYSYTMTTADLTAARVMMVIKHTAATPTFEDTMLLIETYGHTDAQHTFDFSIANQTVIASAGTVTLAAAQVVTVGTNNDKTGYSLTQSFPANFADLSITATTGLVSVSTATLVNVGTIANGAITATAFAANAISAGGIATGAIDADAIAANAISNGAFATGAISSVKFAAGAIDSAAMAIGAFEADVFAVGALSSGAFAAGFLSAGGVAAAALSAGGFAAAFLSAGGIAAGAISAGGIATGAIDADALAADAVDEIWGKALVEPSAQPAITATILSSLSWIHALSLLKITQTATLQTLYQTDGATVISQSTISDDATTFTRSKWTV